MHDLNTGLDNIVAGNGLAIAVTGMSIVFAALTSLSVFIALLPRVLAWLPLSFLQVPDERNDGNVHPPTPEVVAAIAVALHARDSRTGPG